MGLVNSSEKSRLNSGSAGRREGNVCTVGNRNIVILGNLFKTHACCLCSNLCSLLLVALVDVKLVLNHRGNILKRSNAILVYLLHSRNEEVVVVDCNHIGSLVLLGIEHPAGKFPCLVDRAIG